MRLAAGVLLLFGTVISVVLAVTGAEPRAIQLVGAFWAIYGLFTGLLGGVLEPVTDGLGRVLADVGLMRAGAGFSGIETMVARGHYQLAAEAYAERARQPRDRVAATLRRAALLAGPLQMAGVAAAELENLRDGDLAPAHDVQVGLALVDLYDHGLAEPGRAMAELRRLLDRYPAGRHRRQLQRLLADLKSAHFGESHLR